MTQAQLFSNEAPSLPPPPPGKTDTSAEAAAKIQAHVDDSSRKIFSMIKERGGATCDEVEAEIGMIHQSASARIRGLVQAGLIAESPLRRPTRSGRPAIVWIVT